MRSSRTLFIALVLAPLLLVGASGCHQDDDDDADLRSSSQPSDDLAGTAPDDLSPSIELGTSGGHIDPDGGGGDVSLLSFAMFGDVRPSIPDDNGGYPTTVVTGIMKEINAISPQFVVASGDYMYVEFLSSSANAQVSSLKAAEKAVLAPIFHAMGNHECNSLSELNCPNLNESVNITAFLSQLVAFTPVPWYSFVVHTALGDAKFVFIAANAWTDAQATWLTNALAVPSAYTFIIRHQPTPGVKGDTNPSGVAASDAIIAGHPITLFLYGHVHEYSHLGVNSVISGNAGAPLDAGSYGWLQIVQRADKSVAVTAHQLGVAMPIDTWAVTPDGQKAP